MGVYIAPRAMSGATLQRVEVKAPERNSQKIWKSPRLSTTTTQIYASRRPFTFNAGNIIKMNPYEQQQQQQQQLMAAFGMGMNGYPPPPPNGTNMAGMNGMNGMNNMGLTAPLMESVFGRHPAHHQRHHGAPAGQGSMPLPPVRRGGAPSSMTVSAPKGMHRPQPKPGHTAKKNDGKSTGPWSHKEHQQFEKSVIIFGWGNWVQVSFMINYICLWGDKSPSPSELIIFINYAFVLVSSPVLGSK